MSIIVASDPGPGQSACVWWDTETDEQALSDGPPTQLENASYLQLFRTNLKPNHKVFLEAVINYGHSLDIFARDTIRYAAHMERIALDIGCEVFYVPYSDVGVHLVGKRNAKQAQINTAVASRWMYGNVNEAKGTVKAPGKCFGVKEHIWSAVALAVYATDLLNNQSALALATLEKYKVKLGAN